MSICVQVCASNSWLKDFRIFLSGVGDRVERRAKDANPDLILLDIQMPDGNGVEICKRLRSDGFTKPIVMLTAKNAESDIIEGLEWCNDYVTKPLYG